MTNALGLGRLGELEMTLALSWLGLRRACAGAGVVALCEGVEGMEIGLRAAMVQTRWRHCCARWARRSRGRFDTYKRGFGAWYGDIAGDG